MYLNAVNEVSSVLLDLNKISEECHKHDIIFIVDFTHAAGVVELKVHDCNIDGAVIDTDRYLSGGVGAISGIFVHSKHSEVMPGL
jgi:kynureninase